MATGHGRDIVHLVREAYERAQERAKNHARRQQAADAIAHVHQAWAEAARDAPYIYDLRTQINSALWALWNRGFPGVTMVTVGFKPDKHFRYGEPIEEPGWQIIEARRTLLRLTCLPIVVFFVMVASILAYTHQSSLFTTPKIAT